MKELTVIIPIYNENMSNIQTITNFLTRMGAEVLIVDDGSDIPFKNWMGGHVLVIRREMNTGYGAAIKYGMSKATGNYITIIDGDLQYDPTDLWAMWLTLTNEDMVIGRRITHQGGWKRLLGRMFIKTIASIFALQYIPDLNSGSRIFKKSIAKSYLSLLCDEFSFTTSLTMCMLLDKHKVKWRSVGFYPRNGPRSTVRMIRHGLITLFQIIYITIGIRTRRLRKWLRR